jgi:RNA polymerase sigma-70 factor (ECF subfamily)
MNERLILTGQDSAMSAPDKHERFLRLFATHEERIRRYILVLAPRRADADEIFQETAVALWRKFDEYDAEQPFVTWACRFAHFQTLSHRKREAVRRKHLQFSDAAFEALAAEPIPSEDERESWRAALAECVKSLSISQWELIRARYAADTTITDLAKQTGKSVKSLYKSLARIRLQLGNCVQRRLATGGRA